MKVSTFHIEQMDCPTEERMIRNVLEPMKEIEKLDFNLISRLLTVTHTLPDEKPIVAAIRTAGMEAVSRTPEERRVQLKVIQPSIWRKPATILTMISGVLALTAEVLVLAGLAESALAVRILSVAAIVAGGYEVAGKAWRSVRTLTLNINFLMTVAAIGAVVIGE